MVEKGAATSSLLREYVLIGVKEKSMLRVALTAVAGGSLQTTVSLIVHQPNASNALLARSQAWSSSSYAPDSLPPENLGDASRQLMKHSLEVHHHVFFVFWCLGLLCFGVFFFVVCSDAVGPDDKPL